MTYNLYQFASLKRKGEREETGKERLTLQDISR